MVKSFIFDFFQIFCTNQPTFRYNTPLNEPQINRDIHKAITLHRYTGRFIMFSVITNIYNKKTKLPTLMELFTATGKLFFFDNQRCSMCALRVTRHTSIRYSSSCYTRVKMAPSIFFTAVMIRAFTSARSRGNGGANTRSLTHSQRNKHVSYGFPIINFCNPGVHYETPCIKTPTRVSCLCQQQTLTIMT